MKRTLTPLLLIALLATAVGAALAQTESGAPQERPLQLTEDEAAALRQARDLQKELKIARLELALAEARELSERDIAARAEQVYRLQGQLYAFHAKRPELARKVWRHKARHGWGHRGGRGRGQGQGHRGMGRGRGHRAWGMDHGMGRGSGHGAWGMGPGMGRGSGHGAWGMGPGTGRGSGHGAWGMAPGAGRSSGHGMGLGRGPGSGQGRRMRDRASVHLAPGFLSPDVEIGIEIVPEPED